MKRFNETFKMVFGAVGALLALAAIAIIGIWLLIGVWNITTGTFNGIGNWWHTVTTVTPEEQAEIDKANAEWAKDPRNPKVVGQKCIDAGGIPDYSAWDGDVKECKGVGNNKSVNIEVNQ